MIKKIYLLYLIFVFSASNAQTSTNKWILKTKFNESLFGLISSELYFENINFDDEKALPQIFNFVDARQPVDSFMFIVFIDKLNIDSNELKYRFLDINKYHRLNSQRNDIKPDKFSHVFTIFNIKVLVACMDSSISKQFELFNGVKPYGDYEKSILVHKPLRNGKHFLQSYDVVYEFNNGIEKVEKKCSVERKLYTYPESKD